MNDERLSATGTSSEGKSSWWRGAWLAPIGWWLVLNLGWVLRNRGFLFTPQVAAGDAAAEAVRVGLVRDRSYWFFEGHHSPTDLSHPGPVRLWLDALAQQVLGGSGLVTNHYLAGVVGTVPLYLALLVGAVTAGLRSRQRNVVVAFIGLALAWAALQGDRNGRVSVLQLVSGETDFVLISVVFASLVVTLALGERRHSALVTAAICAGLLVQLHWLTFVPGLLLGLYVLTLIRAASRGWYRGAVIAIVLVGWIPVVLRFALDATQRSFLVGAFGVLDKIGQVGLVEMLTGQTLPFPSPWSRVVGCAVYALGAARMMWLLKGRRGVDRPRGGREMRAALLRPYVVAFTAVGSLLVTAHIPATALPYLGIHYRHCVMLIAAALLAEVFAKIRWPRGRARVVAALIGVAVATPTVYGSMLHDPSWLAGDRDGLARVLSEVPDELRNDAPLAVMAEPERPDEFQAANDLHYAATVTVMLVLRQEGIATCYLDDHFSTDVPRRTLHPDVLCPTGRPGDLLVVYDRDEQDETDNRELVTAFRWNTAAAGAQGDGVVRVYRVRR